MKLKIIDKRSEDISEFRLLEIGDIFQDVSTEDFCIKTNIVSGMTNAVNLSDGSSQAYSSHDKVSLVRAELHIIN